MTSPSGDGAKVAQLTFQLADGGSIPTSPLQLSFRAIRYETAIKCVVDNHYLHREAPVSWAFGAYFDGRLMGCLTIGKPASYTLLQGVAGTENADRVFELNRLWLSDDCPRNSESRFIGWVLRILPKGIILVSYADTKYGHRGLVYQATNWIYTGQSVPFTDHTTNGLDHRSVPKHLRKALATDVIERSRKNRYVFFTDKRDRQYLRWPQLSYPKC